MYAVLMKQMLYLKMLAWLEDNIYCNPAIDDLALYMGYSRRFVYDVFYQYGQLPIGQYIRLRRLTIAAVSLRLTRQPIAAIAWQLSYDSPQTFSREFKKRFSLSPREYRCAAHWDTAKLLKIHSLFYYFSYFFFFQALFSFLFYFRPLFLKPYIELFDIDTKKRLKRTGSSIRAF